MTDTSPRRSSGWALGWAAGAGVTGVAAGLLVTLILLARRISEQAGTIADGLERTAGTTAPLWELRDLNRTLERLVRAVGADR